MKKTILILIVILCLLLLQSAVWADENAAAYLDSYYGVTFGSDVTPEDFNQALTALGAEPLTENSLTLADAAVDAVRLANMEELALSYTNEKASGILAEENISADETHAPYIACALELELIEDDCDFSPPVSPETAASLLYRGAELSGKGRHYLGRLSDDDLLSAVRDVFDTILTYDGEMLNEAEINKMMALPVTV